MWRYGQSEREIPFQLREADSSLWWVIKNGVDRAEGCGQGGCGQTKALGFLRQAGFIG